VLYLNAAQTEEPDTSNLDVDYSYFDNAVWPQLANRVKAFESIKLKGAWAGFYEYNTLDQNPIIGRDPYYGNILWATGFSGHGIQMAPAVGRAVMELLFETNYQTIDLTRFGWSRILRDQPLRELNVF
jgi:FAD-dependent oxidoreductase domain-containing protein 1